MCCLLVTDQRSIRTLRASTFTCTTESVCQTRRKTIHYKPSCQSVSDCTSNLNTQCRIILTLWTRPHLQQRTSVPRIILTLWTTPPTADFCSSYHSDAVDQTTPPTADFYSQDGLHHKLAPSLIHWICPRVCAVMSLLAVTGTWTGHKA